MYTKITGHYSKFTGVCVRVCVMGGQWKPFDSLTKPDSLASQYEPFDPESNIGSFLD